MSPDAEAAGAIGGTRQGRVPAHPARPADYPRNWIQLTLTKSFG